MPICSLIFSSRNETVWPNQSSASEVVIQAKAIAGQSGSMWFSQGISLTRLIPDLAILFCISVATVPGDNVRALIPFFTSSI